MIKKKDIQTIKLIQGDTLFAYFDIAALGNMLVDRVIFTCKQLNLNIDCVPVYDDDSSDDSGSDSGDEVSKYGPCKWLLQKNDTSEFLIGDFTYDLTVLTHEAVTTFIYNGMLKVLPPVVRSKGYCKYMDYPHNTIKEHD